MILVQVKNLTWDGNVLTQKLFTVDKLGEAIDAFAPDPGENAIFEIQVLSKDAEVPQLW